MPVSAIVYADFAPTVVVANSLDTLAEVDAWVSSDADGSAAALERYVQSTQTDPDAFVMAGTVDGEPRVHELEADAITSAATLGLVSGESGRLEIRPTLEFVRQADGTLVALAPTLVRDLSVGRRIAVADGTREVIATVLTVDEAAGTLTLDRGLFADQVYVQGLFVEDPERISNAYKFARWLLSQDLPSQAILQGFNPELYRMLYLPGDADLKDMTYSELVDDYVHHPDRIGNVLDLERAIRNQAFSHMDVETGIGMGPGAGMVFSDGGMLAGMFRSGQVQGTPSRAEGSDSLAVTPAALMAIVAREKAILLQHVQARRVSVSDGGLEVAGETVLDGRLAAAAIEASGYVDLTSDARVQGDLDVGGALVVAGQGAAFDCPVTLRDGAHVSGGAVADTLRVTQETDLIGKTRAEALEVSGTLDAAVMAVTYLNASAADVGALTGVGARFAEKVEAHELAATAGRVDTLVVDGSLETDLLHAQTAVVARVTADTLEARDAHVAEVAAETVAAALFRGDAVEVDTVAAASVETARVKTGRLDANEVDARSLGVQEANVSTLVAASVRVHGCLEATEVDAEQYRGHGLSVATATVAALAADSIHSTSVHVTDSVSAAHVAAEEITAATVVGAAVRADVMNASSVATATLIAEQGTVQTLVADSGDFAAVRVDTLSGGQANLDRARAACADIGSLSADDAVVHTLRSHRAQTEVGQVGDLQVTGETRAARVLATCLTADEVEAAATDTERLTARNASVATLDAQTAAVRDMSAQHARFEDAFATGLRTDRLDAVRVESEIVVGTEVHAETLAAAAVAVKRADVVTLKVADALQAASAVIDGNVVAGGADIRGQLRTDSLRADCVGAVTLEAADALVDSLTARDVKAAGVVSAAHLVADTATVDSARVRLFRAAAAELEALEASGITLTDGTLDTSRGDVIMGTATARALRCDIVHALRATADTLTTADLEAARLRVSGVAAVGSLDVAQDVLALGVRARNADVEDLTVSRRAVFSGDARFDTGRLDLPLHVDCAGTLAVAASITAPDAHVQSAFVTRINIGR